MNDTKNIAILSGFILIMYMFIKKTKSLVKIKNIVDDLEKHPTKVYSKRNLNQIDKMILHHFASNGTPYAVAKYHIRPDKNNWPGIGYHYVISKDGTIYQTNFLDTISYHVSGQNTSSIGIALEGNFENEPHIQIQIDSLNKLIPYLRSQFVQPLEVYQHSDFANKPYDANLNLAPYKL
jgi:N-acetylmuramoyl-L-alanine amidase|tara:strand:+ start:11324 stop:11860 length:537 start_codon:yes stop_codon:yes gene_type:complete